MFRILFFLIGFALFSRPVAAVEIYANGHRYDSFEAYKASQAPLADPAPQAAAVQPSSTPVMFDKLYVLGVEHGMADALQGFYQQGPDFNFSPAISQAQLEQTLAQAVTASKEPKLLISQPGKLRILTLKDGPSKRP